MSLADDLLHQAKHLADWDLSKPRQASLRRSISSAYYALFHLLTSTCAERMSPANPRTLPPRIVRAISHAEIKEVCLPISKGTPGMVLQELLPAGFSAEMRNFAKTFVDLQEARHRADYDLSATYSRPDTLEILKQVEDAFSDWGTIQHSDEANVFMSAILFAKRWGR